MDAIKSIRRPRLAYMIYKNKMRFGVEKGTGRLEEKIKDEPCHHG